MPPLQFGVDEEAGGQAPLAIRLRHAAVFAAFAAAVFACIAVGLSVTDLLVGPEVAQLRGASLVSNNSLDNARFAAQAAVGFLVAAGGLARAAAAVARRRPRSAGAQD